MAGMREYKALRHEWEEEDSVLDNGSDWDESSKEDSDVEVDEEVHSDTGEDPEDNWRLRMQQLRERKDWLSTCHEDGGYGWDDGADECEEDMSISWSDYEEEQSEEEASGEEEYEDDSDEDEQEEGMQQREEETLE